MSVARVLLAPLHGGALLRVGIYLVLGGVVAGAYVLLVVAFGRMFSMPDTSVVPTAVLALATAALVVPPPFLAPVRVVEILAARAFVDVDVPEPHRSPSPATRWRAATWYVLHLTLGAVVVAGLFVVVPVALELIFAAFGSDAFGSEGWPPWGALPAGAWAALAVVVLLALPYVAAACAAVLRQAAPALLGPDQAERIAELEARGDRLAERGRLARELHDSVGHALTVTTLQAAAAARSLDRDPEAARRSLAAIEETGRTALADLDHVLGLLRDERTTPGTRSDARPDGRSGPRGERTPTLTPRTLDDVSSLLDEVRAAGGVVELASVGSGGGDPGSAGAPVPRAVSREAYRVVQEALTNALRHAPGASSEIGWDATPEHLVVEVRNGPVPDRSAPTPTLTATRPGSTDGSSRRPGHDGARHGLAGMRERVAILDGRLTVGPTPDGGWAVRAMFPLPRRSVESGRVRSGTS